ncbi:hypothetical protein [Segniliparus rugosus]|uniref:hypothetical protein n=1 Tax=Segniliparus rugosus TaxID=286804 RepID=UPI0012EBF6F1|nr:hypothetical protein [Segniliparus rugosus]
MVYGWVILRFCRNPARLAGKLRAEAAQEQHGGEPESGEAKDEREISHKAIVLPGRPDSGRGNAILTVPARNLDGILTIPVKLG